MSFILYGTREESPGSSDLVLVLSFAACHMGTMMSDFYKISKLRSNKSVFRGDLMLFSPAIVQYFTFDITKRYVQLKVVAWLYFLIRKRHSSHIIK